MTKSNMGHKRYLFITVGLTPFSWIVFKSLLSVVGVMTSWSLIRFVTLPLDPFKVRFFFEDLTSNHCSHISYRLTFVKNVFVFFTK